jgi:hypothetical protein
LEEDTGRTDDRHAYPERRCAYPQTFRVDTLAGGNYTGEATSTRVQSIVLLGIREHPDLPDTDVRAGDRFVLGMSL